MTAKQVNRAVDNSDICTDLANFLKAAAAKDGFSVQVRMARRSNNLGIAGETAGIVVSVEIKPDGNVSLDCVWRSVIEGRRLALKTAKFNDIVFCGLRQHGNRGSQKCYQAYFEVWPEDTDTL